jgi:hypothetical protein
MASTADSSGQTYRSITIPRELDMQEALILNTETFEARPVMLPVGHDDELDTVSYAEHVVKTAKAGGRVHSAVLALAEALLAASGSGVETVEELEELPVDSAIESGGRPALKTPAGVWLYSDGTTWEPQLPATVLYRGV